MSAYPNMLSPMKIKGVEFKNRVFAAPCTSSRIVRDGVPTAEGIDVYETRARGGFAQVTFTECFVDHEYAARHDNSMRLWETDMSCFQMESIQLLTEAIHAHGAVASVQLNHAGAANHPDLIPGGKNPIGPSGVLRPDGVWVEEMDEAMMDRVADHFAGAALTCKRLGFDMVMLHGGHGWLLHQFISSRTNHRRDRYGGSLENRARFPKLVLDRIRRACGEDFLIEYRVSGAERVPGGMEVEETARFCAMIQDQVDLIHVTSGIYLNHVESKSFSSMFDEHGCNLDLARVIKRAVHIPVVAVGGFNAPEQVEAAISSRACDFVALGRQQLADPDFVKKAEEGRAHHISPCLRCSCFNPMPPDPEQRPAPPAFFCAVNPLAGRELRWRQAPKPEGSRRVLVIGGGVAGLYAAFTAARRGHQVTLAEKSDRLGGVLWFTDADVHKESLRRFRDSLIARCRDAGVALRLRTLVTPESLRSGEWDAVICAIGAVPAVPPIPGIDRAIPVLDAYSNLRELGRRIVIIGGGLAGCETGLLLSELGRRVHILEREAEIARDALYSHRIALLPRMERGLTWDCGVQITEILPQGVRFLDEDGAEKLIAADSVLYATGMRSRDGEYQALRRAFPRMTAVGDCKRPRRVNDACYEGFAAAMDIL